MPAMFADDPIPPQTPDQSQATCANNARLDVNGEYYGIYQLVESIERSER
jgi:hypothetical protein